MIIFYQHRIYRKDIQANRTILYIFGDNLKRQGFGGQAKEMRDEPNSFGIATKRTPAHNYPEDYFHDTESDVIGIIDNEFDHLHSRIKAEHWVMICVPLDGIGTGLSRMKEFAPIALEYINQRLKELKNL